MKKLLPLLCFILAILLCGTTCLSAETSHDQNSGVNSEIQDSGSEIQDSTTSNDRQDDSSSSDIHGEDDSGAEICAIDFSDKTYIAFGDSITYGADFTRGYAAMDNPYPTLVAEELKLKSFTNAGWSGATLIENDLGLGCIANSVCGIKKTFDIISVLGGVNDYNRCLPLGALGDKDKSTVYGSLDCIATYLTTNFDNSFIFFMTPYKEFLHKTSCLTDNSQGYNLQDVANAIKQVANKYNLPVLDLFNDGQFELEMTKSSSDGIHPSQQFVTDYTAPQIARFIKENYKQQ